MAGSSLRPKTSTPIDWQVLERTGEAGRGDDLVGIDGDLHARCPSARSRRAANRPCARCARWTRSGRTRRRPGSRPRRAARSARGCRPASGVLMLSLAGRGEASTMRWAHWSSPRGELEAAVLLAHDEQALAGIRLRGARVDVVRHKVEARRIGLVRLGHADGEDRHLAAVVAVGGVQHEALAVARRALPAGAVADLAARSAQRTWRG